MENLTYNIYERSLFSLYVCNMCIVECQDETISALNFLRDILMMDGLYVVEL